MRLNLKAKLFGGFAVVLMLMILATVITFYQLNKNNEVNEQALNKVNETGFLLEKEIDHWSWLSQLANRIILDNEFSGQLDPEKCGFGQWYYQLKEAETYSALSPEFKQAFADIEAPHIRLHDTAAKIMQNYESEPDHEAAELNAIAIYRSESLPAIEDVKAHLKELRKILDAEKQILAAKVIADQQTMKIILVVTTVVAVLIGLLVGFLVNRGITRPVMTMVEMLKNMAQSGGDLTKRINISAKDEIGDLADWFNAFLDKLHDIIGQVKQSAGMVATAANETSLGNQDLSQRTEEQASSLEEISSTIEEVTSSLQKSTESAASADKNSKGTLDKVHKGEIVVKELQQAMQAITQGSHEIADIIAKVNDIAFQTNLLALNAAVEAARAGEQGRGFAVVAAEVRNLAGRTAESAKEIEGLIKDSISKVEHGNELMGQTASVLNEIIVNSQETTEVIIEIASSMKEQASAAEDIRIAIEQLNQVTQQNASLVEEIAGSSESVSNEAEELSNLVGQFTLKE